MLSRPIAERYDRYPLFLDTEASGTTERRAVGCAAIMVRRASEYEQGRREPDALGKSGRVESGDEQEKY